MHMRKLFIVFFLFIGAITHAQSELLDSASLANVKEYTDLAIALNHKDSVIKLVLRKKKFKEFPKEILQFKNLQYLDISKNTIRFLPDSITTLKNLQVFICSRTELDSLPQNFGDLVNLKHINCNQNELTILPYSFGNLTKLEYADFWDNNMDQFHGSMANLTSLKRLDLRNILISKSKQDALSAQLPHTKIYFSPPCNCGL